MQINDTNKDYDRKCLIELDKAKQGQTIFLCNQCYKIYVRKIRNKK